MRFLIVLSLALLAVGAAADSNPVEEVPTDNSPSGVKPADEIPKEDGPNDNTSSGSGQGVIAQRLRALFEKLNSYRQRFNDGETFAPQYPWAQQGREPNVDPAFSRPVVPGVNPPLEGVDVALDAGGPKAPAGQNEGVVNA